MTDTRSTSSPAVIALVWAIVVIPTAWGVYNTGLNAMKLFKNAPAAAAPTAPAPPPPAH